MASNSEPQLRGHHPADQYATKLVGKAGDLQNKAADLTGKKDKDNQSEPAGGYDNTPLQQASTGYTIRITFVRAENLPFSDINTLSTDPYIHATLKTSLQKRHKQDPDLTLRTPTIHKNTNPIWNTQWVIAHVPESGFYLKCRLYDEDPADHDDRLGNAHITIPRISEDWQGFKEQSYELKKRSGSKRAYAFRGIAVLLRKNTKMNARLVISVENLGRSPGNSGSRCFTVAPLAWSRHHSPLIGRLAGTKDDEEQTDGRKSVQRYNFQAVQMQLRGPVPAEMYHRYVEFKPFVAGMFTDVTLRGRILNRALHHQHARIYNYDSTTVYGIFDKPGPEMTKQFLDLCHYDKGGRIFTYVLSLDGLLRFTETGNEFGIDMLSKHTMHSDVSIYIAFSGEFMIRRLKRPHSRQAGSAEQHGGETEHAMQNLSLESSPDNNRRSGSSQATHDDIPEDPSYYELIIDNDSGTYRPNAKLLPLLREYMSLNFPGIRVATLDCQADEERMKRLKENQRERKKHSGKQITYMQNSSMSSLSSSDEEELDARAEGRKAEHGYKRRLARKDRGKSTGTGNSSSQMSGESRDSRDYDSSISEAGGTTAAQGNEAQTVAQAGYPNDQLPELVKKDANGKIAMPEGAPADSAPQGEGSEAFQKGENRPQGGIAVNEVVRLSSVVGR